MSDLIFHHAPMSRGNIVSWMLEELGIPYTPKLMSLERSEQKSAAYLKINPMGKVPAIEHKGVIITEAAAICAYLADEFPQARLAPTVGDPQRGLYFKWLFFGPSCLEQAILDRMNSRPLVNARASSYGDYDTVMETIAAGIKGPYLLGEHFTAADVVLGSGLQWGTMMKALPERPEFTAYLGKLQQRPAPQRAFAKNQKWYAELHPEQKAG